MKKAAPDVRPGRRSGPVDLLDKLEFTNIERSYYHVEIV